MDLMDKRFVEFAELMRARLVPAAQTDLRSDVRSPREKVRTADKLVRSVVGSGQNAFCNGRAELLHLHSGDDEETGVDAATADLVLFRAQDLSDMT